MIWKNPFLSKNSEQQMDEDQFLSLFDCTVLQMIEQQNLEKVSYVSSTPGAGKTSLFRAFSPGVLNQILIPEAKQENKEFRQQMMRLGIIENDQVFLATAMLSCARGYSIIDEMFVNGRRKQIFFALLNFRITIVLLRNIGYILDLAIEDFARIKFRYIPVEMMSEAEHMGDGKKLYEWACQGEKELCKYLDSERNQELDISFVHSTLLMIKLFEPNNILIDGESYFHNILVIFDDFHKLSGEQRRHVSEAIYTLKASTGVWFGQRLEGLQNEQLISMDGSLNRDYNPNIVIDNYWPDKAEMFYKMLGRIADRRVKEAAIGNYSKLSDCITNDLEGKKYAKALREYNNSLRQQIEANRDSKYIYEEIIEHLKQDQDMSIFEQAVWYECIIIKENRRKSEQLSFFASERTSLEEFKEFVKENKSAAKFYLSRNAGLPVYYSMDHLKILSSYNVEQFLFFAAAYLDHCRIKTIGQSLKSRKRLTTEEQEKAICVAAEQKWEDMDFRYINIRSIKNFLNNIANICINSRDEERGSYSGGAYTGIGIKKSVLVNSIGHPHYEELADILGACVASKYLERKEINYGDIVVFYLNRWLCVHYGLPLAYGGWKRCGMNALASLCKDEDLFRDDDQMTLSFFEV